MVASSLRRTSNPGSSNGLSYSSKTFFSCGWVSHELMAFTKSIARWGFSARRRGFRRDPRHNRQGKEEEDRTKWRQDPGPVIGEIHIADGGDIHRIPCRHPQTGGRWPCLPINDTVTGYYVGARHQGG